MTPRPSTDSLERQMSDLLDRMGAAEAENRRLSDEIRVLRTGEPHHAGAPVEAAIEGHDAPVSRRGMLLGGAAAVGAAVAISGTASPAAADDGETLVVGTVRTGATSATGVNASLPGGMIGTFVNNAADGDGVSGQGGGATGGAGVRGSTDAGSGVIGQAVAGWGVGGNSDTGPGVVGESNSADGVRGSSQSGMGVRGGTSTGDFAVVGFANTTTGTGGVSNSGDGVSGDSVSGTGTRGSSDTGVGVMAISNKVGVVVDAPTQVTLVPRVGSPTADTFHHDAGDQVMDTDGNLWTCVMHGTPGTWRKLAGQSSAGTIHIRPAPARVYDSRPGTYPSVGPKTRLTANVARTIDLKVNNSGVPAGATAAMLTLLVVNASPGNANFTVWANGVGRPQSNTMVWGGNTGRFSTTAVTSIDALGRCQVVCSLPTDVVIDVIGFYR